jgi:hypothetical protein
MCQHLGRQGVFRQVTAGTPVGDDEGAVGVCTGQEKPFFGGCTRGRIQTRPAWQEGVKICSLSVCPIGR